MALIGFTDETGTVEYNMRLSQDRAEAVGDYLRQLGIPEDKIIIEEGRGEIAGRQAKNLNRRVDIVVTMR